MSVTVLPKTEVFNELIPLLEITRMRISPKTTGTGKGGRLKFPQFYGMTLGRVKERGTGKVVDKSKQTRENVELWNTVKELGNMVCPFPFTSVQVNKNLQCPKHTDVKNVGNSMLVSFGDYKGSKIMIEGKEYDARRNPVIFNGSQLEHWNTEQKGGTKYSLVFYSM
tara:strand:- start:417 stop:917 length:501 start_codon:yes stop_codon:yes gene_type:complete